MAKKKKPTGLRPRQRKFVQALANGANSLGQAAIEAGYSDKNPRQTGSQVLKGIQAKMSDILDRHGLTDDVLIDKYLRPLLSANIVRAFAPQGKVIYSKKMADNDTRRQTLDMAFKLKGAYSPKTEEEARLTQHFTGPTVIVLDIARPNRDAVQRQNEKEATR